LREARAQSPWRTHCGRDQPLGWNDPHGALAAVEDLRGQLRREALLSHLRKDEAAQMARTQMRRDVLLKTTRDRANRNRQREEAIRAADPEFLLRRNQLVMAKVGRQECGKGTPRVATGVTAAAVSDVLLPTGLGIPTSQRNERPTPASPQPPLPAPRASTQRPWSARTGREQAAAAVAVSPLTVKEAKLLGIRAPRPSSVFGHLLQAERFSAPATAAADRLIMPLPAPLVVVTPRPPSARQP
jgi:hypothetical protein